MAIVADPTYPPSRHQCAPRGPMMVPGAHAKRRLPFQAAGTRVCEKFELLQFAKPARAAAPPTEPADLLRLAALRRGRAASLETRGPGARPPVGRGCRGCAARERSISGEALPAMRGRRRSSRAETGQAEAGAGASTGAGAKAKGAAGRAASARRAEVVTQLLFGHVFRSGVARCEGFLECEDPPAAHGVTSANAQKAQQDQDLGVLADAFLVLAVARTRASQTSTSNSSANANLVCLFRFADAEADRPLECIDVGEIYPDVCTGVIIVSFARTPSAFQNAWVLRFATRNEAQEWTMCIGDVLAGRYESHMATVKRVRAAAASLDNVVEHVDGQSAGVPTASAVDTARASGVSRPPLRASRSVPELSDDLHGPQNQVMQAALRAMPGGRRRRAPTSLRQELREMMYDAQTTDAAGTSTLARRAGAGALAKSGLRTAAWRIFLGVIPSDPSLWVQTLARSRLSVDVLVSQHMMTRSMVTQQLDLLAQKGLSADYIGAALRHLHFAFARHEQICREIWKDITRTKVIHDRFSGPAEHAVKEMMLRILLVWSKTNSHIGYRQGMNELVAVLFVALQQEYAAAAGELSRVASSQATREGLNTDPEYALLSALLDTGYVEHDTYLLLDALMVRLTPVFKLTTEDPFAGQSLAGSLPAKLEYIQHILLQRTDPELAAQLHVLGVEPSFFLLRWIRLILVRDIGMPQLLLVWDAIFGLTPSDFSLIDTLCIAILTDQSIVRKELIEADDCVVALQALKRLPALDDEQVLRLIHCARQVKQDYDSIPAHIKEALVHRKYEPCTNQDASHGCADSERRRVDSLASHADAPCESGSDDDWIRIDTFATSSSDERGPDRDLALSSSPAHRSSQGSQFQFSDATFSRNQSGMHDQGSSAASSSSSSTSSTSSSSSRSLGGYLFAQALSEPRGVVRRLQSFQSGASRMLRTRIQGNNPPTESNAPSLDDV